MLMCLPVFEVSDDQNIVTQNPLLCASSCAMGVRKLRYSSGEAVDSKEKSFVCNAWKGSTPTRFRHSITGSSFCAQGHPGTGADIRPVRNALTRPNLAPTMIAHSRAP